jgi:hypothetical protein
MGSEVGDELVACAAGDKSSANLLEGLERRRLEAKMVHAAPFEHRRLPLRLRVAVDLEHVEFLCAGTDVR